MILIYRIPSNSITHPPMTRNHLFYNSSDLEERGGGRKWGERERGVIRKREERKELYRKRKERERERERERCERKHYPNIAQ